jgi:hypothetical protein
MASAAEVLRAAGAIIEAGWSQGAVARGNGGRPVPLFAGTGGDTSRATVNRDAVWFSLYGAICKATSDAGGCSRLPLLWDVLYRHAINGTEESGQTPHGGTNHVHPVIQFNEHPGRTKEEVMALLEIAAQDCEAIGDGAFPPPVGVTPAQIAEVVG